MLKSAMKSVSDLVRYLEGVNVESYYKNASFNDQDQDLFDLWREYKENLSKQRTEGLLSTNQKPSSYGRLSRYLLRKARSAWSQSISEEVKASIIGNKIPRCYHDSFFDSSDVIFEIAYKHWSQHDLLRQYIKQGVRLPKCFDRLKILRDSLGLTNYRILPIDELLPDSCGAARGLRCILPLLKEKYLIEVATYFKGYYGRFIVLVSLGIGCTVWFGIMPSIDGCLPDTGPFTRMTPEFLYNNFNNEYFQPSNFRKMTFVQSHDVTNQVLNALLNEKPFSDVMISSDCTNQNVLKAVGLGVIVAFFLSTGLIQSNALYT